MKRKDWRPARSGVDAGLQPSLRRGCWWWRNLPARGGARSNGRFLRHAGAAFEFSLGVPLSQVALARAALLALRWLDDSLGEQELDWLISTGLLAANAQETAALQGYMRRLRHNGLERTHWSLRAFLGERCAAELLPAAWVERVTSAQRLLAGFARRPQSPLDWAELIRACWIELHFASARPLASAEFQALRRWQQAVENLRLAGL